ncbi:MAG: acyl carrier protein [Gammaproteobacteria bacterium]
MQTIQTEIRQFIVENFLFGQRSKQLGDDDSFLDGGIIDSTGVLELIAFLEEKYGISIEDEELVPANLDSVTRVATFVERKLQTKAVSAKA